MRTHIIAGIVAGAAALVISAPQAHADAELEILVNSSVVYDSGDQAGPTLSKDYSSGGVTVDATGLAGTGYLDLDNIDVNGAGKVQVIFSDNNNPAPGGVAVLAVSGHDVSGSLNGSVDAFWSASNNLLAQTSWLAGLSSLTGDGTASGAFHASSWYSLTEVVTITSGHGTLSTDDSITVPDGGLTVAMLGGAMSVLALVRKSKLS